MLLVVAVILVRWGATTKATNVLPQSLAMCLLCDAAMMHSDFIDAEGKIVAVNVMVKDASPEASALWKTYPARNK